MTPRDKRIEDLRVGIVAAQEPINSRDVWELSLHEKKKLVDQVSENVKKMRQEMSRLIKEREVDRASGAEKDNPCEVSPMLSENASPTRAT